MDCAFSIATPLLPASHFFSNSNCPYNYRQRSFSSTTTSRQNTYCSQRRPRITKTSIPTTLENSSTANTNRTTSNVRNIDNTPSNNISYLPNTLRQIFVETPISSIALLNLVTVLWGTQHSVIKLAVNDTSPSSLTFARFLLGAIVSLPSLPSPFQFKNVWKKGIEQGFYLFSGYALQALALLTTSASRSAFLLYLNVKLVPLFARVLYGRKIPQSVWISAITAFSGTVLLAWDGSPPVSGDLFSLFAACASALFILRMESASRECDAAPLNSVSLLTVAVLSGIWSFADTQSVHNISDLIQQVIPTNMSSIGAVFYLGIVTTAISNYIQAIGQRNISAENAAIIFALDPVYGALFAYWILGEHLGTQGFIGGGLILIAAIMSAKGAIGNNQRVSEIESVDETTTLDKDFDIESKTRNDYIKRYNSSTKLNEQIIIDEYGATNRNDA